MTEIVQIEKSEVTTTVAKAPEVKTEVVVEKTPAKIATVEPEEVTAETPYKLITKIEYPNPSQWAIKTLSDGRILAENNIRQEAFVGTIAEFNELLR